MKLDQNQVTEDTEILTCVVCKSKSPCKSCLTGGEIAEELQTEGFSRGEKASPITLSSAASRPSNASVQRVEFTPVV